MGTRTRGSSQIDKLRLELEAAARDLAPLQTESSRLISENEANRKEIFSQNNTIAKNRELIYTLEQQIPQLEKEAYDILLKRDEWHQGHLLREVKKKELDEKIASLEQDIVRIESDRDTSIVRHEVVLKEIEDESAVLAVLKNEKLSLDRLTKKKSKELELLMEKENAVNSAIEEALRDFRIFEGRISQFSEETGYLVRYRSPELALTT